MMNYCLANRQRSIYSPAGITWGEYIYNKLTEHVKDELKLAVDNNGQMTSKDKMAFYVQMWPGYSKCINVLGKSFCLLNRAYVVPKRLQGVDVINVDAMLAQVWSDIIFDPCVKEIISSIGTFLCEPTVGDNNIGLNVDDIVKFIEAILDVPSIRQNGMITVDRKTNLSAIKHFIEEPFLQTLKAVIDQQINDSFNNCNKWKIILCGNLVQKKCSYFIQFLCKRNYRSSSREIRAFAA